MSRADAIDLKGRLGGVTYAKEEGIATITLNRPERGNSLAPSMMATFRAIWADVRDDPGVRVAVIEAEGDRHFCTGMDVSEADGDDAGDVFVDRPFAESVYWSPHQNQVWKPVLCAVNGTCVGGGLHFVVDSDIRRSAPTNSVSSTSWSTNRETLCPQHRKWRV